MGLLIALAIIIVVVAIFLKPMKGVRSLSAHQLKQELHDEGKVYIDVRTPEEFKKGHIKQFRNLPLGEDFSTLPKGKEIVVICRTGGRSKQACKQLKALGYDKITNVRGGMGMY